MRKEERVLLPSKKGWLKGKKLLGKLPPRRIRSSFLIHNL
jgi:hypothetical protein